MLDVPDYPREVGYTYIPSYIADRMFELRLNGEQFCILWALLRRKYGVFEKEPPEPTHAILADETEIELSHFCDEIQLMLDRNVVTISQKGVADVFEFNDNYEDWKLF